MQAFATGLEPAALVGKVVRLQSDEGEELRRVNALEPIGEGGPIDIFAEDDSGASSLSADGSTDPIEIAELETSRNQVAQARIDILTKMRLQLRQPKDEDRRENLAGGTTRLTMALPPQLREVFVNRAKVPQFIVDNPNKYTINKAIINFSGFKLILDPDEVSPGQIDGTAVAMPVGSLGRITQGASTSAAMTQGVGNGGGV